jgi:hypothetical protein
VSKEPKIRSVGKVLTAGVDNTVYTCPDNFIAKIVLIFVSNHGGVSKTFTIEWNDVSAGASYYLVGGIQLAAADYFKMDGSYLVLNPGDTLIITPEAGSSMDATVTVEEYYEQGLF